MRWLVIAGVLAVAGCGSSHEADGTDGGVGPGTMGVGATCRPLAVPMRDVDGDGRNDGYSSAEAYVETGTIMCATDGCLVYHLAGDPRPTCNPTMSECADPAEVARRVYCSCRCAGAPGTPLCRCPGDFVCLPLPELDMTPLAGSYCLRADTTI